MVSNSSLFLCRLRNAAARFFTSRASRLLRPETSGGTNSFVVTRSPRAFFDAPPSLDTDGRFAGTTTDPALLHCSIWCCSCGEVCGDESGEVAGLDAGTMGSGKSNS